MDFNNSTAVKCVAKNCQYNDNKDHCVAEEIYVTTPQAISSKDTRCETFIPREDY